MLLNAKIAVRRHQMYVIKRYKYVITYCGYFNEVGAEESCENDNKKENDHVPHVKDYLMFRDADF